jgi:hypothetical protein
MHYLRTAVTFAILLLTAGCAYSSFEDDGSGRIVGFASVAVADAGAGKTVTGCLLEITGFGGLVADSGPDRSMGLGWFRRRASLLTDASASGEEGSASCPDSSPFGWVSIDLPKQASSSAGVAVQTEMVGLGFARTGRDQDLIAGYSDLAMVRLRRDVAVLGDPLGELETAFTAQGGKKGN